MAGDHARDRVRHAVGDVGPFGQHREGHLLRADREEHDVGRGEPAQRLVLAAQPQAVGRVDVAPGGVGSGRK